MQLLNPLLSADDSVPFDDLRADIDDSAFSVAAMQAQALRKIREEIAQSDAVHSPQLDASPLITSAVLGEEHPVDALSATIKETSQFASLPEHQKKQDPQETEILASETVRYAGDFRSVRAEISQLRLQLRYMEEEKATQTAAQLRLQEENADLAAQVAAYRRQTSELSRQLRAMQSALIQGSIGETSCEGGILETLQSLLDSTASLLATPARSRSPVGPLRATVESRGGDPPTPDSIRNCISGTEGALSKIRGTVTPPTAETTSWRSEAREGLAWSEDPVETTESRPTLLEGCGPGRLNTHLLELKAQMAAVEAQGASLRLTTRKVEQEYWKMITAGSNSSTPRLDANSWNSQAPEPSSCKVLLLPCTPSSAFREVHTF
jgi:hypothetical protein